MSEPVSVTLKVNGKALTANAATADTLLTVLRDQLLLTGAKRGCNQGVCGACTVLADGRPVRACLSLAFDCDDRRIDTIEGLNDQPVMQALQRAFITGGAYQCGQRRRAAVGRADIGEPGVARAPGRDGADSEDRQAALGG